MATVWLPINKAPKHAVMNEREYWMARLRATGYSLMGEPDEMKDITFLRDVVQRCEEKKATEDAKRAKQLIDYPEVPRYSRKQVQEAIKDLLAFQKRKAAGTRALY